MLLNILTHFLLQKFFSFFPPLKLRCILWSENMVIYCTVIPQFFPQIKLSLAAKAHKKLKSGINGCFSIRKSMQSYLYIYSWEIWFTTRNSGPGWCSSVNWVPACKSNDRRFDSQSGHMLGLQARSPVGGAQETATHWCFSPSLYPSLTLYKE